MSKNKIIKINLENFILFISLLLLCFNSTCLQLPEKPGMADNPLDPNNPSYDPPRVTILSGPENNSVITTESVTFTWRGNKEDMDFRHRLDNNEWSDYSNRTSVNYDLLDDEDHTFIIQGKYKTGDEGELLEVEFTVDAISAPAFYLYPRNIDIYSEDNFNLDLKIDIEDSVSILSIKLTFDPILLSAEDVTFYDTTIDGFLLKNGGELITFSNIENDSGFVQLDCAVYHGYPHDVSGEGNIAKIAFKHKTGENVNINISKQSMARNSDNIKVGINHYIGSVIKIN